LRRLGGVLTLVGFGQVIAIRDIGVAGTFSNGGAISFPHNFNVLFFFTLDAFGIMALAEFLGGIVAVFLEGLDLAGETAKGSQRTAILFGLGGELLGGFGPEKELDEVGGGELEADLRDLAGVVLAKVIGEVVLEQAELEGVFLLETPFFEATARFPVGDVARGDSETDVREGRGDLIIGDVVEEHAIDHVTRGFGKAGDFTVAGEFP